MQYLVSRYEVSTRRACGVIRATRSSAYYRSRKDPLTALRQRMRELAQTRVRFGYRRLRGMMVREGWEVGKERFYRVYIEEGLALRRKRPWRHANGVHREQRRQSCGCILARISTQACIFSARFGARCRFRSRSCNATTGWSFPWRSSWPLKPLASSTGTSSHADRNRTARSNGAIASTPRSLGAATTLTRWPAPKSPSQNGSGATTTNGSRWHCAAEHRWRSFAPPCPPLSPLTMTPMSSERARALHQPKGARAVNGESGRILAGPILTKQCTSAQPEPQSGFRENALCPLWRMVSRDGIEPSTRRLRVCCSAN